MKESRKKQVGGNHYKKMKIQPIEYIVANQLEYRVANIIKYISRYKDKNGLQDLEKAKHYLEMLIEEEKEKIKDAETIDKISLGQ